MTDPHAGDCVAADKRDCVARDNPVAALEGQLGGAGVLEAYAVTLGEEVNLPGAVSNCPLTVRGSMHAVCNRIFTINEVSLALGRKRRQPFKLGACASRIGNS